MAKIGITIADIRAGALDLLPAQILRRTASEDRRPAARVRFSYLLVAYDLWSSSISATPSPSFISSISAPSSPARSTPTPRRSVGRAGPRPRRGAEADHPEGRRAEPDRPAPGCRFRTRCPYAFERCSEGEPAMREVLPGHHVVCHLRARCRSPRSHKAQRFQCRLEVRRREPERAGRRSHLPLVTNPKGRANG
jgi:oligopeptide/dipeptide ABC transporter ATP-binding protein